MLLFTSDNFNSFIDNSGLINLPLGGRLFTWMNKAGTKLSKLDLFLISKEVVEALPDVRVTAIDRLWSDHNPILLHVSKSDFGPIPFKLLSHEKFRLLKARIKQLHSKTKTSDRVTKHDNLQVIKYIEEKIEVSVVNDDDCDSRIKLLQEVDRLDTFESFDLLKKAKSFSTFFKEKFKEHNSNVDFPPFANFFGLCALDRNSLETHVSLGEVKNAVWDYGSSKAPSPDGFLFTFVNKYWDYIKVDIWSVHYKIIAKILANQLAKVIDKIVSHKKSPFIAGRQILDGLLILSEIVEWLKKEKVVNFQACLSSSRASVLVNGSPTLEFSIKCSLRQGDPLSPFLFIIFMEGLHNALFIAVSSGLIRGVKFGSPKVTISHLFYVDDVIITTEWNAIDLDNIIHVLQVFYLASGLKINIQKSDVCGIGVSDVDVSSMASNFGCAS
ncbi:putative RNA-directed DNA polymerase, eukaryota, reverse transcriptase zinc-binding domain protein [Tanacetum coccineum]